MREGEDLIVLIIVFAGGLFSILASVLNWNFFFENRRANIFVKILGRNGARIFYFLLGLFLLFLGYLILDNLI